MTNMFYIYQHRKADTNEIFYVGKGKDRRSHSKYRGDYWKKVAAKHGFIVEIIHQGLDEQTAFILETETIKEYRNQGIKLVNLTDGGEGTSGRVATDESKEKYSHSKRGIKNPMFQNTHRPDVIEKIREAARINHAKPEVKAKVKSAHAGKVLTDTHKENIRKVRLGTNRSDETKLKLSLLKKGKPSNRLGATLSEETKRKLRLANLGKKLSEETKAKLSAAGKGRVMSAESKAKISSANKGKFSYRKGLTGFVTSDETKEKLRQINKGKTLSDETKAKMSLARARRNASGEVKDK